MQHLKSLLGTDAEFRHLCDDLRQGVPDQEWVPQIAATGCVVITSDGGRQSKRGLKLPDILRAFGVTHVILSPTLHSKPMSEKVAALVSVWPELERLTLERNARFVLKYQSSRGGISVRLERKSR